MTDARLLLGSALAIPVAFALFVLLPYAHPDLTMPLGLEPVWGVAGVLSLILVPVAWGIVGYISGVCLVFGKDTTKGDRRLHVATLAVLVASVVLLGSETSTAAMQWWLD